MTKALLGHICPLQVPFLIDSALQIVFLEQILNQPTTMDIALLSVSNNVYSTRRIAEEAQILGHYIEQVDHTQCSILLRDGSSQIRYRGDDLSQAFDVIIPRIGNRVTRHGVAVVKQFELSGAFSCARSISIMRARNKARTLQLLARKNIPVPNTIFSIDPDTVEAQIASIGGAPIIIKIQEGTHASVSFWQKPSNLPSRLSTLSIKWIQASFYRNILPKVKEKTFGSL